METAGEAVGRLALSDTEKRSVRSDVQAAAPARFLLLRLAGLSVLMELAWLSGIGYFVYWLLR